MRLLTTLTVVLTTGLSVGYSPTSQALSEPQARGITKHLDSSACRKDTTLFDGTNIVSGVAFKDFRAYYTGHVKCLNAAIGAFKRLPPGDRADSDARKLAGIIQVKQKWVMAMKVAYEKGAKVERARLDAQKKAAPKKLDRKTTFKLCEGFRKAVVNAPKSRPNGSRLINQHRGGKAYLQTVKEFVSHRKTLELAKTECAQAKYAPIVARGRVCSFTSTPVDDPYWWCQVAANGDKVMKGFAESYAAKLVELKRDRLKKGTLRRKGGWLTVNGPTTYAEASSLPESTIKAFEAELAPIWTELGMSPPSYDNLYGPWRKDYIVVKQEIDALAPTFKAPKGKKTKQTKLAAKMLKKRHPGAKVITSVLTSNDWTLRKKRMVEVKTGRRVMVADYRFKPGRILFQLPGEPWCQLVGFTVSQVADSQGRLPKKKTVDFRFDSVRFQRCK